MQLPRILAVPQVAQYTSHRVDGSHDDLLHMGGGLQCTTYLPMYGTTQSLAALGLPPCQVVAHRVFAYTARIVKLVVPTYLPSITRKLLAVRYRLFTDGLETRLLVRARLNAKSCEPLNQHRGRC